MTKITNQNYPNGLNPLGYMGVNAPTPGQQVVQLNRAPTPTDAQNFTIGTQWLATVSGAQQIWELVSLSRGIATWVQLYPAGGGSGGASEFPTDSGTANEVGGVLNVLGGPNINTVGSGDTVTVGLDTTITVDGVRDTSMSDGAVVSDGSGNLTSIAGTAGQVLTSNGAGMAPTFQPGGGGGGGIATLTANTGTPATAASIKLQGNNVITTNGLISGAEIDFSLVNGTNGQLLIGGGTQPTWNNLTSTGGTVAITYPSNNNINLESTGTAPATSCAFFYYQATLVNNVTGDGTYYSLGSASALTAKYDLGGNVTPGSGVGTPAQFTAPATGIYFLQMQVTPVNNTGSTTQFGSLNITITGTSADVYQAFQGTSSGFGAPRPTPIDMQAVIPMTAGDVAVFNFRSAVSGSLNIGVQGRAVFSGGPNGLTSWICGYRVA